MSEVTPGLSFGSPDAGGASDDGASGAEPLAGRPSPPVAAPSRLCHRIAVGPRRLDRNIRIVRPPHTLRVRVEACISDVYERAFGASDLAFPRRLVAWLDDADHPVCAAGLRKAADGFFSEIYLDSPIEQVLLMRTGETVARNRIFEVTTLASRNPEVSPLFIRQLALLGKVAGFEWSFFTATTRLRKLLCQLGIPIVELAAADPTRVANLDSWGSYYTQSPLVCAVSKQGLDGWTVPIPKVLADA